MRALSLLLGCLLVSGCLSQLKSRNDLKGDTSISQSGEVSSVDSGEVMVSESPSVPAFRQEERNSQMRVLQGRVEEAENEVSQLRESIIQLAESRQQEKEEAAMRLQAYEEAIRNLEKEIQALKAGGSQPSPNKERTESKKPSADSNARLREDFYRGEDFFKQEKWKDAIVAYQKYRDDYPKGQYYPEATYKMGLCFLELGLKDESKSFFDEVRVKFPKSPLAKKADQKLKSL